jgi:L-alanine-DL-glutamate epimerase-like enolase superfamily enzyme
MMTWSIEKKILELKYTWKISRNTSDTKTNLFVTVTDGISEGMGEVAPNIRYGESPEQTIEQFELFLKSTPVNIPSLEKLNEFLEKVSLSHSLHFAIESAFVHYLCDKQKINVPEFFEIEIAHSTPISFSIPIMDIGKMKSFYETHNLKRFAYIKIKTNAEECFEVVKHLAAFCKQPIMVDTNEAFRNVEDCILTLEKLKRHNIEFIEQPLPSAMMDESFYLKKYSPFRLFADESIAQEADFSSLKKMFDGVNIKLMKAGGYYNAIRLLKAAKANNLRTMIGCMVETTLGISSAMNLCSLADYADLDSFLLVKNEPFELIEERDGKIFKRLSSQALHLM